jgi:site-specific DNA recombinase
MPEQRYGIYTRISADREGQQLGVARQERDSESLAARLGGRIHHVFSDNDASVGPTSTKPRPDYKAMLQDARTGKINAILAYSTSRLTRRPREVEDLIDLAVAHGIRFYFVVSPPWDLNTADGRERARQDAARDRGEVERLQERILRRKLSDAEAGAYPGGRRCYAIGSLIGVNPANGKEVRDWTQLDPAETTVLKEMAKRVLMGETQFSLVRDFNRRGVPTSLGYKWTVGKLKRTLLNESYVIFDPEDPAKRGTRLHKGNKHRAVWPGIFTRVEHDMLVNYFKHNPDSWQQGQVLARRYLLSGFTYCGLCGGVVYGQGKTANGKYIRRYHCKKYNNRGEQVGCCKVFRIADPVELLVSEAVLFRFDSPQVAEALAPAEDKQRVRELTEKLVYYQSRKKQLATEHAIEPYEDYGVMLAALKGKSEEIQTELNRLRSEEAKRAMVPAIGNIREMWETASLEWKSSVIRLVVDRVVILPSKPSGSKLWRGFRFEPESIRIEWKC